MNGQIRSEVSLFKFVYLDVSRHRAAPMKIESPQLAVLISIADRAEEINVERREAIVGWVGAAVVHRVLLGSSSTRLRAALSQMNVAVGSEPSHAVVDKLDCLGVGQIHHQPVRKDQIDAKLGTIK